LFLGRRVYREIPEELRSVIEPIVQDHALELVDVEILGGRGARVVRVTIDTPTGDGRVPVEQCVAVSREVGTQLDERDAISGRYRLEVSSPGLDRMLAREKDFAAAVGQDVRIETRRPLDGRRRFRGRLEAFDGAEARVTVDGHAVAIRFDEVARASTVYAFSSTDFGRGR
jgi:ribosome maturation factor RimP